MLLQGILHPSIFELNLKYTIKKRGFMKRYYTFKSIQKHSKAFKSIQKHSKAFKSIQKHSC